MGERTHKRRYSPVYPSVSLLCFPMSQSIFILSLCSPDDLQRRSLLIPSAPSLWSHYKPHIYLIEPAACCLPAWTAAGQSVCVSIRLCVPISMCVLYSYVCICECGVYYLTWGSKMSERKMSQVTYSVSRLLRRPGCGADTVSVFHLFNLLHMNPPQHTQNKKHTLEQR